MRLFSVEFVMKFCPLFLEAHNLDRCHSVLFLRSYDKYRLFPVQTYEWYLA